MQQELISMKDLAKHLDCSTRTLRRLLNSQRLHAHGLREVRIGRKRMFVKDSIDRMIESMSEKMAAD